MLRAIMRYIMFDGRGRKHPYAALHITSFIHMSRLSPRILQGLNFGRLHDRHCLNGLVLARKSQSGGGDTGREVKDEGVFCIESCIESCISLP